MAIKKSQFGMTLIEVIVVVTIISLVSAVLMFNYSGFSSNANIRNLAQEIALGIRKSQIYATSVARTGSVTDPIYGAYGVSFSKSLSLEPANPTSKRFVLFADIVTPNNKYDYPGNSIPNSKCGGGTECLETLTINSSDDIIKVEACSIVNGENICIEPGRTGSVDIVFKRPSPDAFICLNKINTAGCGTDVYSSARITIRSSKGLEKEISVWNTGQISIK